MIRPKPRLVWKNSLLKTQKTKKNPKSKKLRTDSLYRSFFVQLETTDKHHGTSVNHLSAPNQAQVEPKSGHQCRNVAA